MKKIIKSIALIAVAAAALVSCQTKELEPIVKPSGKVVYFGTTLNDLTKASLSTEDDNVFSAAWENNDVLNVSGFVFDEWYSDFSGTWDAGKNAFAVTGADDYFDDTNDFIGVYPQAVEGVIDFGSARIQDGNNYTGKYDVMLSEATTLTLVEDEKFVLPMDRQTAIAYFHLTSNTLPEDEKIVSATLSVNENIAGSFTYSKGKLTPSKTAKSITLSFTNAPSVRNLQLWFNVFPGTYTGLKLEVETENYTLTIQNNNAVTYAPGKLYKVAGDATAKYAEKYPWKEVTSASELVEGTYVIAWVPTGDNDNKYYYLKTVTSTVAKNPASGTSNPTVSGGRIKSDVSSDMRWTFTGNNSNGFKISCGDYVLGASDGAQGISINTSNTHVWKGVNSTNDTYRGILLQAYNNGARIGSRNLALFYTSKDWRFYSQFGGGNYYGELHLFRLTSDSNPGGDGEGNNPEGDNPEGNDPEGNDGHKHSLGAATYSLTFNKLTSGTNYNNYINPHDITVSSKGWTVYGNQSAGTWLQVGGRNTTPTDRTLTSKASISSSRIGKVSVVHEGVGNGRDSEVTINSIKVEGSTSSTFASNVKEKTITSPDVADAGTLDFQLEDGDWDANSFFRITVNYKITGGNNSYIKISSVKFYPCI